MEPVSWTLVMNYKTLLTSSLIALALTATSHAATVFTTNTSGNAAALAGAGAGTITPLTLSAEDGGGTLNLTTVSVFDTNGVTTIGMDANSLGVNNDKWGIDQEWTFSFDLTLSFDGFVMNDTNTVQDPFLISSSAWIGNTVTNGSNWTFNSTTGTISTIAIPTAETTFTFTGSGLADVTAGTSITIAHNFNGGGGVEMRSFTVSPIPEASTLALLGLSGLLLLIRRRR